MAADAVTSVHGAYVRLAAHVKRAEALVHEARANSREIKNILEQQQLLTQRYLCLDALYQLGQQTVNLSWHAGHCC